ncbi:MAG: tRNA (guanosine(46)-N7)-methyltransferase TrmB [Simkaniaceae bacterium]|jgi:tRNA (guanine-N7-)-methyltransferase
MKPKDLPYPFTWEKRRPFFKEGIFYVPDYYEGHDPTLLPPLKTFFGNEHPVHIEYCSGNGEWVIAQAQKCPDWNWIAVEKKFERVRKIYAKGENLGLSNLLVISGDALIFSREYLPEASIAAAYVNFPDPWPKERHAKHRLIQKPFTNELFRTIKRGGTVTLVTDNVPYLEQMQREMEEWKPKKITFDSYGSSYFERLWLSKGLKIHYLHYER